MWQESGNAGERIQLLLPEHFGIAHRPQLHLHRLEDPAHSPHPRNLQETNQGRSGRHAARQN